MQKKPLGIVIVGDLSIFFGVLLLFNLVFEWANLIKQYTLIIAIVYLLFGGGLIASGVGIIKLKNWGRWLLMGLCGFLLFLLIIAVASSAFEPDAINALTILILLWPLALFLSPIIYLTRGKVKEYFGVEE